MELTAFRHELSPYHLLLLFLQHNLNWSLYDLLVVKNETLEPETFAKQLSSHLLRSLTQ